MEAETVGRSRREIRGNILKTPDVTGHGNGSLRSVKVEQVIGFIRNSVFLLVSNTSPETVLTNQRFSFFYSVPPGKGPDITSKEVTSASST